MYRIMVGVFLSMFAPSAFAAPSSLVIFGDSLSDAGNAGRFSNGPVWVERLAQRLGLEARPARMGGTNFAVGGARAFGGPNDLEEQIDELLARSEPAPDALYVLYIGSNDLRAAAHASRPAEIMASAASAVERAIERLALAGARRLLVPNLPDVGRTPEAQEIGGAWPAQARQLAISFNHDLARILDEQEARHGLQITRLDVYALLERAAADPTAFGMSDVRTPCQDAGAADCETHLFWDVMHPTAAGHARLAEAALEAVFGRAR